VATRSELSSKKRKDKDEGLSSNLGDSRENIYICERRPMSKKISSSLYFPNRIDSYILSMYV